MLLAVHVENEFYVGVFAFHCSATHRNRTMYAFSFRHHKTLKVIVDDIYFVILIFVDEFMTKVLSFESTLRC